MFTRCLRLSLALVVGVLAGVALPAAGASAEEGGRLEVRASSNESETHAGDIYDVRSAVRNTGTSTLYNVTLTHTLPAGVVLDYADGSYADGENVDHAVSDRVVTFFFPELEPGEGARRGVATVTIEVPDGFAVGERLMGEVTASSPDSLVPAVTAVAECGDAVCAEDPCAHDAASVCISKEIVHGPRFTFTLQTETVSALPGDTVDFAIEVHNSGEVDASASIVGSLPPVLSFVESEVLTPSEFIDPSEGASFWDSITVPAGETLSFGVVTTMGEAPPGTIVTFALRLFVLGVVEYPTPCSDGSDSWFGARGGCAAIAVARAGAAGPPVARPPAPRPAAPRPAAPRPVAPPAPAPGAAAPAAPAPAALPAADAPGAVVGETAGEAAPGVLADIGSAPAEPVAAALAALALGVLLLASRGISARRSVRAGSAPSHADATGAR